jgi:hypothetical protein
MEASGVISMELTVGSKSLATAFFVVEVQGNYSAILGHDWIHANHCIPPTLHQFLIQCINNEVEVVHADASAYIALADVTVDWQHRSTQCLSVKDLTGYDLAHVCAANFQSSAWRCSFPIGALKNIEWLRPRMQQYRSTTNDMSKAMGEIGFESTKNLTTNDT